MKINEVTSSFNIEVDSKKGKPDWNKFSNDLRETTKKVETLSEFQKVIKFNRYAIKEFKKQQPELFQTTLKEVFNGFLSKSAKPILEGVYVLPKSDKDIRNVLDMLRNGIKIQEAKEKLKGLFECDTISSIILEQVTDYPDCNFASCLTNVIINLEPKTPELRKLQHSIFQDKDLADLIVPKYDLPKEKSLIRLVHEDLLELHYAKMFTEETANDIVRIRAFQYNESYKNLKNQYFRHYKKDSIIPYDDCIKSVFELKETLKNKKNRLTETQIIQEVSANYQIEPEQMFETYKEIFINPAKKIQENSKYKLLKDNLVSYLDYFTLTENNYKRILSNVAGQYAGLNENYDDSFKTAHKILEIYVTLK